MRRATFFEKEDNCVSCHVDNINKLFKETLNHSLVPGKITGNPYEPAQCKKGFGLTKYDLNVFILYNPILTPPNDNLLLQASATHTWKRVRELYPYFFSEKDEEEPERLPTIEDYTAQRLFSFARTTTTRTKIFKDLDKIVTNERAQIKQNLANLETVELTESANAGTQALAYEMQTMLQLFESFRGLFIDIVKEPCRELPQKPVTP
jgi:hypothetical protein